MSKSGIYKITCLGNGKIYIGSTSNFVDRQNKHFDALKYKYHCNSKLQNAYNKYGRHQFKWEEIEYISRFENETLLDFGKRLEIREQYYLDTLLFAQEFIKSKHKDKRFHAIGLNICPTAGNSTGRPNVNKGKPGKLTSEATKQKQREAKLKNPTRYWLGKKLPNDMKTKISPIGRKDSEQTKMLKSEAYWNNYNAGLLKFKRKSAIIINPLGEEIFVDNIKQFVKDNGLDYTSLLKVISGKHKQHLGYTLKQAA